jgi:hypothetical protein
MGGRPKGLPDYAELVVARLIGRNLTPLQGCVVQIAAMAIFLVAVWALFASGLFLRIVDPIAKWYASQAFPPHVSPSTLP